MIRNGCIWTHQKNIFPNCEQTMSIPTVCIRLQYFSLIIRGGYKALICYIRSSCLRPKLCKHNLKTGNRAHWRINEICIQNILRKVSSTNPKDVEILGKTVKGLTYISVSQTMFLRALVFCEMSIGDLWKNQPKKQIILLNLNLAYLIKV